MAGLKPMLGSILGLMLLSVAVIGVSTAAHADQSEALVSMPAGSSVRGCEATDECFIPSVVTIEVGGEVTWRNDDTAAHTATGGSIENGPDGVFDSDLFLPGYEFSHTFEEAGEYPYYCLVHPWRSGTVVVVKSEPAPGFVVLDPPPQRVSVGDTVVFSGYLGAVTGGAIEGGAVRIMYEPVIGPDRAILTAVTDENGRFSEEWTAKRRMGGAYDFYAAFQGDDSAGAAYSEKAVVEVVPYFLREYRSAPEPTRGAASISLDPVAGRVFAGDEIEFTGRLLAGGLPLAGVPVHVMEDDPFRLDQRLGHGVTDQTGRFSAAWRASADPIETELEIYARFDGNDAYERTRTPSQSMEVLKYGGTLTLDPVPDAVSAGDAVFFSGTLTLESGSTEGAPIYIKDKDVLERDDLLATAYVDEAGGFSAAWSASRVDDDGTAEVYAVFEGTETAYRLTTCGDGGDAPRSSWIRCDNAASLDVSDAIPATADGTGGAYMELFYSLDLPEAPRVAIVPNPDSYESVANSASHVREGVEIWGEELAKRHGGSWDVDFEIVPPGAYFGSRPDIVVNLVASDQDELCDDRFSGVAILSFHRPIQTKVCADLPERVVAATATHEFIHAMGLGHAFNKPGDFMCSVESAEPTCSVERPKIGAPSEFNLDAVSLLYGEDGFTNPNADVVPETRMYENGSVTVPRVPQRETACGSPSPTYDLGVSRTLGPGWYTGLALCSDNISYRLSVEEAEGEFVVYMLDPGTDMDTFVRFGYGSYNSCEDPRGIWRERTNACEIEAGSMIVLYNPGDSTVTISGRIWSR